MHRNFIDMGMGQIKKLCVAGSLSLHQQGVLPHKRQGTRREKGTGLHGIHMYNLASRERHAHLIAELVDT